MLSTSSARTPASNPSSEHCPAGGAAQQSQHQLSQKPSVNYRNAAMDVDAPLAHGHAHTVEPKVQAQFDPRLPVQYRKPAYGITITPLEHRTLVPYDCPFFPADSLCDCPKVLYTGAEILAHAKAVHENDQVSLVLWGLMARRMYSDDLAKLQDWVASRPAGFYF